MTLRFLVLTMLSMAVASAALAQMSHQTMDHGAEHSHDAPKAGAQNQSSDQSSALVPLIMSSDTEILTAVEAGGSPIMVKVLGAVCDFCAMAMNKTMAKETAIAASFVDLDTKVLTIVVKDGMSLSDEAIQSRVKKSGYKVDRIERP